jgi:hypothetical protein
MKADEPKKEMIGGFDKWEVEGWARTLIDAEEIKSNPKKMKAVAPLVKDKIKGLKGLEKSISSMSELRAKVSEDREIMAEEEMEDDEE